MKQYTFKDGTKVIAGSVEEAKAKHKALAYTDELGKLLEEIGILGKGNIRYEYGASGNYELVLNSERNADFNGMWLGDILTKKGTSNYWFYSKGLDCLIDKENAKKIKNSINKSIQFEIDRMKKEQAYLESLKF